MRRKRDKEDEEIMRMRGKRDKEDEGGGRKDTEDEGEKEIKRVR